MCFVGEYCLDVPEGGAGLSVLGSVLLMIPGVFIHLPFGSLPRHKTDIIIAPKERYITGSEKVGGRGIHRPLAQGARSARRAGGRGAAPHHERAEDSVRFSARGPRRASPAGGQRYEHYMRK